MDRKSTDRIGHKNEDLREILEKEREQRERGIIERENREREKEKDGKDRVITNNFDHYVKTFIERS